MPSGEPRLAVSQAASIAANAMTLSIERSMWPAMMQKERPTASRPTKVACWRMLMKMPSWKKCSIVTEHRIRMTARMPQTRWSRASRRSGEGPAPRAPRSSARVKGGPSYSTTFTGSVGGLRLPQKRLSSTLSLVMAAPGIFRFGPHSSIVSSLFSPFTS